MTKNEITVPHVFTQHYSRHDWNDSTMKTNIFIQLYARAQIWCIETEDRTSKTQNLKTIQLAKEEKVWNALLDNMQNKWNQRRLRFVEMLCWNQYNILLARDSRFERISYKTACSLDRTTKLAGLILVDLLLILVFVEKRCSQPFVL